MKIYARPPSDRRIEGKKYSKNLENYVILTAEF